MSESEADFDLGYLKSISQGDESFIIDMVKTYKELAPEFINNATRYLDSKNYLALSKEAHKLVPGVGFMGMKSLEKDLCLLEEYSKKEYNLDQVEELLNSSILKINRIIDKLNKEFNLS